MKKILSKIWLFLSIVTMFSCSGSVDPNHNHTYSESYSYNDNQHWLDAICGHNDVKDKGNHNFSEWIVSEKPTEQHKGSQFKYCLTCGFKQVQVLEKLPHVHTFSDNYSKNKTHHWKNSTCGHDDAVNKEEHEFTAWDIIEEATENKEGSKQRICLVCDYLDKETIAKLPHVHKFEDKWSYDENTHYHLSTCGHDEKNNEAEHIFVYGECSTCGYIKTTEGLTFEINETNTYTVTGIGSASDYTKISIPSKYNDFDVVAIKENAFANCTNLIFVNVPDSVTTIGSAAFSGCTSLEKISLPFIGNELDSTDNAYFGYVFGADSYSDNASTVPVSLKEVTITGDKKIPFGAFDGCNNITTINLPNGLIEIDSYAFSGCSSLINLVIPNTVNSILSRAFYNCSSLKSIVIPLSVSSIKHYVFQGCSSLTIYCETSSKPTDWDINWNNSNCPVYWYSDTKPTETGNYWHYDENNNIAHW